jgi:hypothetical protein
VVISRKVNVGSKCDEATAIRLALATNDCSAVLIARQPECDGQFSGQGIHGRTIHPLVVDWSGFEGENYEGTNQKDKLG